MRRLAAALLAAVAGCGPGDSGMPAGGPPKAAEAVPVAERLRRGQELLAGDRLADAAVEFRAALGKDATSVQALEGLSRVAARMNDAPASLAFISRAAELSPEDGALVNQLGVALVSNDRKREAARTFERALALRPKDPLVLLNAAQNQADLGDWPRARRYAEAAAALIPEDATPWLLMGRFEMRQEKFAEAVAPLREAARRAPGQSMVQYYLGKSLAAAGRRSEAEAPLRAALEGRPPDDVRREIESLLPK